MKKRNVFNVIICFAISFFMLFAAAGCFENPDRDHVSNKNDTTQGDTTGGNNNQTDDNNKGDDNNNDDQTSDDNDNDNNNDDQNNNNDNNNDDNEEEMQTTINIVGFGDSIAAGYAVEGSDMYASYTAFDNGDVDINDMCFTNIIAGQFSSSYDVVNAKSYAKSGDKTNDLIDKFNDEITYPNLLTDVENADIITLCIGANNVLTVALDNLSNYFAGSMPIDYIETLLQQGVESFKNDYSNTIIPNLTQYGAEVYVMTIYDPFYYFSVADIDFISSNVYMAQFAETYMENQFNKLKTLAIEYLDEINSYIKSQNYENVVVVDVNETLKTLSKTEYSQLINADSTKISINVDDIFDLSTFSIRYENVSSLTNNSYFDPHPTSLGQKYIANLFLRAMGVDEVAL